MSWLPLLVTETDFWKEEFFGLEGDQRFVVLLVAIGCMTALCIVITGIVAGVYASMKSRRQDVELKQEMLDRGMSAEEIAEVIKAAPVDDVASRWVETWRQKKKSE